MRGAIVSTAWSAEQSPITQTTNIECEVFSDAIDSPIDLSQK